MPPKDDPETAKLRKELEDLVNKIKEEQKKVADTTMAEACASVGDAPKVRLVTRKNLKGHINKVNSVHYSGDNRHAVSGSLDGKLIIWDTWTGNKIQVIPLRSSWVMSVAFAPSGNFNVKKQEFTGHNGDVVTMSLSPDNNTYVTGSVDQSCKLWDARSPDCKQVFFGHTADVNSVCFHPSGQAFGTGSEDKSSRLYDLRSDQQLAQFAPPSGQPGFTSCALSSSGRFIMCGADDNNIHIWDTLKVQHNGILSSHENRVTSISMSTNGMALCSASWDQNVRVWG
ncbi:hypothetical protein FOCC_FOCC006271 [Frankliniella occidentalis]|nr:hypothetical protein FOCC_FOCC006271 [Frankliniella occidentalis]